MGCKVSCRRSTLEKHLGEECIFARQIKDMDVASKADNFNPDDYEVFIHDLTAFYHDVISYHVI